MVWKLGYNKVFKFWVAYLLFKSSCLQLLLYIVLSSLSLSPWPLSAAVAAAVSRLLTILLKQWVDFEVCESGRSWSETCSLTLTIRICAHDHLEPTNLCTIYAIKVVVHLLPSMSIGFSWTPNFPPKVAIKRKISNTRKCFFTVGVKGRHLFQGKLNLLTRKATVADSLAIYQNIMHSHLLISLDGLFQPYLVMSVAFCPVIVYTSFT